MKKMHDQTVKHEKKLLEKPELKKFKKIAEKFYITRQISLGSFVNIKVEKNLYCKRISILILGIRVNKVFVGY